MSVRVEEKIAAIVKCHFFFPAEKWYKTLSEEHFEQLILVYKNVFVDRLKTIERSYVSNEMVGFSRQYAVVAFQCVFRLQPEFWDQPLIIPLEVLRRLNVLNKCNGGTTYEKHGGFKVSCNTFHVSELSEYVDIRLDYVKWIFRDPPNVSILEENTALESSARLMSRIVPVFAVQILFL